MHKRDQLLRSIESDDTGIRANGVTYGDSMDRGSDAPIRGGQMEAIFEITAAFAAGNFTLTLCSGSTASPTAIVATSALINRVSLEVGDKVVVPVPGFVLDRYWRLGVTNSAISATGGMIGDLVVTAGY